MAFNADMIASSCDKTWWHNVLLMDNFLSHWGDHDHAGDYCFGWAWYLSNDFHMFLTAPIIIYVLHLNKKIGWSLISVLVVATTLVMTFVWYTNEYSKGFSNVTRDPHDNTF